MTLLRELENWMSPAVVRALGYALLHSLWQGAVLAGLLAAALPLLRRARPEVRYAASAVALAGLLLAVAGTLTYYAQHPAVGVALEPDSQPVHHQAVVLAGSQPAPATALLPALARACEPYLPALVAAWLLGLLLMGGRLAGGLAVASRLRRSGVQAIGEGWQQRLAALAVRAGLRRPVALLESARVSGPLVLGHLRPVILLPLGAVAGLPPALLEALLAHELAHVLRRDYLLNLGLSAVEVLFFYHPAVWFMAGCLRAERENCCDDRAAALCGGDRLRVAHALAALAELEAATPAVPRLALAAAGAGGRGTLLARVRRLALGSPQAPTVRERLLAGLLCLLGVAGVGTSLALAAPAARPAPAALRSTARPALPPVPADTTKRKRAKTTTTVTTSPDGQLPTVVTATDSAVTVTTATTVVRPGREMRDRRVRQEGPAGDPQPRTIVIEKDKKGRLERLLVDGQPVPTEQPGKKSRRSRKEAAQVEIVQVPPPAAAWSMAPNSGSWSGAWNLGPGGQGSGSGSWSTGPEASGEAPAPAEAATDARGQAQRSLTEALRNPDLTAKQRKAIEQARRSLGTPDEWEDAERPRPLYRIESRNGRYRLLPVPRRSPAAGSPYRVLPVPRQPGSLGSPMLLRKSWGSSGAKNFNLNGTLNGTGFRFDQAGFEAGRRQLELGQRELELAQREFELSQREFELGRQPGKASADKQKQDATQRAELSRQRAALADQRAALADQRAGLARTQTDLAARRAELQARLDATQAELQALDTEPNAPARAPRALRALRVPRTPLSATAPLPPLPPAAPGQVAPPPPPPGANSTVVRDELRRDGLIGKADRNFSLHLSSDGGRVNGRTLTPEQARKYRRLLGHEDGQDQTELRMELKEK